MYSTIRGHYILTNPIYISMFYDIDMYSKIVIMPSPSHPQLQLPSGMGPSPHQLV